jgi:hypothetical protein
VDPRLVLDAAFKFFTGIFTEFAIHDQLTYPVVIMITGQEFKREIPLGKGENGIEIQ